MALEYKSSIQDRGVLMNDYKGKVFWEQSQNNTSTVIVYYIYITKWKNGFHQSAATTTQKEYPECVLT